MNIENAEFPLMDTSPSHQASSDIQAKTFPPTQHFIDANSICEELRKCTTAIKTLKNNIQIVQTMTSDTKEPELTSLKQINKTYQQRLEDLQKRLCTL
ncbi:hypothetical protein HNY73_011783 [Argiope bruennichi]|uniref:Uncharacterized protein n=1 Tax=Argiope bruennichi TaxID=94029 RepID=A0A8T0EYI7_ARGBR|nr:hypothetical protein HNY73_011783 [Argiope bruennichi]